MTEFMPLLHAEWTKFRTVRGWVIAMVIAILATIGVGLLGHDGCGYSTSPGTVSACPALPTGPGGEAVQDAFYFAHQPLTGNGTITVQLTSLTGAYGQGQAPAGQSSLKSGGLQPWSKAGIIIKENTAQGSAYAAMMVTGSNGVRMQWDYVNDTPGMTGSVSASSPRWLRLVRTGDAILGYDSADGTRWTLVDKVTLPGLTSTVQAGLFAASPGYSFTASSGIGNGSVGGGPVMATAVFRHVGVSWPASAWTGTDVGGNGPNGVGLPGTFTQSAGTISLSGSGDIAPAQPGNSLWNALVGSFAGLIALIVVGAVFITTEYRRGLIRISLAASPRRGRLLAAKAVVIGAVSFVTGLIAAILAVAIGKHSLTAFGAPLLPIPMSAEMRMIVGTALLLAVAAVLALAIGTIMRRSATAVATVIVVIFIPYLLALVPGLFPQGVSDWVLRLTPAAGFSIQQPFPAYPQVGGASYAPAAGYYPLAPWAGLAVECAWAVAALVLAAYLLRRRDA